MNLMNAKEFCNRIAISKRTLNRIIAANELTPIYKRSRLYFTEQHVQQYIGSIKNETDRKIIAYYRVSTSSQKKEIENQKNALENFSINNGFKIDEYLYDVGSGINFKRKNFLKIIDEVIKGNIDTVIITYKDRLCRFAFELLEYFFSKFNTEIYIINIESTSPQEELIEDLMTIIHVFSSRLYGLRKYKKEIKNDLYNETKNTSNR
jgi:putative resolvase